tara:strand:- start:1070 stop:1252 length:183 start_codon:yes stop_codon:yes gene_type:complete
VAVEILHLTILVLVVVLQVEAVQEVETLVLLCKQLVVAEAVEDQVLLQVLVHKVEMVDQV